jgi:hypothetical protein
VSNRMGRVKKIRTGKRTCVRCHEPIFNEFRKQPWCEDCGIELQQMSYNGEEVLQMVMDIMPPTPPHPDATIKAWTVLRIARKVLLDRELLLPNDEEPTDQQPGGPRKILLS